MRVRSALNVTVGARGDAALDVSSTGATTFEKRAIASTGWDALTGALVGIGDGAASIRAALDIWSVIGAVA